MATPNRYVGRHAASGGLGPVHACPSIPAWPHDRSLVPGNYSPDVSGGRHSFPSPVLWQLAGLTYDVTESAVGIFEQFEKFAGFLALAVTD